MHMTNGDHNPELAKHLFNDAVERLKYQHEYTIAGLKTLIWINGGAIIALLTYAGNGGNFGALHLHLSFVGYAAGIAAAAASYLCAYISQGAYMQYSTINGILRLGFAVEDANTRADRFKTWGNRARLTGGVLSVLGLVAFVFGSYHALMALT
jgi:hypothetical protein